MNGRTLLVMLLVALLGTVSGGTATGQGLKLGETMEKEVSRGMAPNPHNELDCTECHKEKPEAAPGKGDRSKVSFVNDLPEDQLCFQCHDKGVNVHPVYRDPATSDPKVAVPVFLPLGVAGDAAGKVICTTCHFIHTEYAGYKLLRGFPLKIGEQGRFTDRTQFCKSCHGDGLIKKSPHLGQKSGEKGCSFCHATMPKPGEKVVFRLGIVDLCNFCHQATRQAHYLKVNPFSDPSLQSEVPKLSLPLIGGEYTCVTCHEPHGGTSEPHYLRDEYVAFAVKSRRIRPHFQDTFCLTCHKKQPVKGGKLADFTLLEADPTDLCNRCHASGLAVSDIHPLRAVPKGFGGKVPDLFPLTKGKLTCLSCHTPGDQTEFDPADPYFLRGAPYANRNDICWKCHDKDAFARLDPHQDIQTGQGCEFCHQKKPDVSKKIDVAQLDFKGDIILLCLRCHAPIPHPADHDHTGVPAERWKENIAKDFPLDKQGRLTCASCHNPHVSGESKTRGIAVGLEICGSCHVKF